MKPLAALFLFLLATPGTAQQQPQKLTLAAAIDLAEKQNLDLVAARAQRAVALAGVQIARERPNPTANFTALRDSPHEGLFFDQPLEIGPKRRRRIELAEQQGQVTESSISALERQVRRSVREAYFGLAFARGVTAENSEIAKLTERLREIARARFEAGDIPQLEVIQAELEVARAQANYQVAQQEEKVALSQLNTLLNEPAATPWELEGPLNALPPRLSLEELIARAGGSNAELQRLAQESKVEERRRALLEAQRIPNLGLQFGTDFNSPRDFRVGPRGQISMELPLFTRNQGEIAQSRASLRVLEDETVATRRSVAGRVEAAYFELDARQAQVQLYRKSLVPSSKQFESLAEESYRAGKASILTVLDAQREVQQVGRGYLDSLFAMQQAFARLEETVGTPLD